MRLRAGLAVLVLCLATAASGQDSATSSGGDWPQFRGPDGQGHAVTESAPLAWSETENVRWKTPVPGTGWSSPVVAGGRVWLTTAVREREGTRTGPMSLRAIAFDLESGQELVNVELFRGPSPEIYNIKNSEASPTPVVSGDRVFVHFGWLGTAALSTSGDVLWKTRLDYESQHGNGGSPIVYRDLLIISADGHDDAFVIALDTATGKTRWRTRRRFPFDQAYSTPLAITTPSGDQIVSAGAHRAAAYEPERGREVWHVNYRGGFSNVPRPVFGHGLVFITTGFDDPSLLAVKVDGEGDVTRSHVVWTIRRGVPHTPSPILVGDLLFFVSDIGIATCVDARTGEPKWQQRLHGNYSASPILAAGRLYFQSEEGTTTVVAPTEEFTVLARNQLGGSTLASFAVAGRAFIVRSDTHLYRLEQ